MSDINHMPDVDFELDTFTVVLLRAGARAGELGQADAKRLLAEHLEYTMGLWAEGHVLAAGALEDSADEGRLTGLGFSSKTPDELRPLLEDDPAVKAGLETFRLLTYRCPKEAIAFPQSVAG